MVSAPVRLISVTHQPLSPVVSQAVTLACRDAKGRALDVPASLTYDPHDPWAITVVFRGSHDDVTWVVGRDLLLQGVTDPVGEGDVQLWPSIDATGRAAVVIEFCSPEGRLVTQLRTHDLYRFLARTLSLVPQGCEVIDLDALVDCLRGSESP